MFAAQKTSQPQTLPPGECSRSHRTFTQQWSWLKLLRCVFSADTGRQEPTELSAVGCRPSARVGLVEYLGPESAPFSCSLLLPSSTFLLRMRGDFVIPGLDVIFSGGSFSVTCVSYAVLILQIHSFRSSILSRSGSP